jgi:hypothetical protein
VSARSAVVFALRVSLVFVLAGLWVGFCASRFSAGCGARRAARAGSALLLSLWGWWAGRAGLDLAGSRVKFSLNTYVSLIPVRFKAREPRGEGCQDRGHG